jgi:uncharacterized SAM-binding protein YcdF (DUF218 family)
MYRFRLLVPGWLLTLFIMILIPFIFNSCYYSRKSAQKLFDASKAEVFDVVVVPGVPFEKGKWSKTMKGRVYWSWFLYNKGIAKNVMYSGSAVYSPYYEGIIMAMYAQALGIPRENIFYETDAEHSTENIYYSYQKAKKLGFEKVALASDPFQTRSLKRFTRKRVSPDIVLLPMVSDTMKVLKDKMKDPDIDSGKAFKTDFISIRKREGFFKRLRGTLGRNIKYASN